MGTPGRKLANLVSWSKVQESVTPQTAECCSCLNAELKHTNWRKAVRTGKRKRWTQCRTGEEHTELHTAVEWGGFTLSDLSKTKIKKTKYHVKPKSNKVSLGGSNHSSYRAVCNISPSSLLGLPRLQ